MINRLGAAFDSRVDDDEFSTSIVCPACDGEGEFLSPAGRAAALLTPDTACEECGASGRVEP